METLIYILKVNLYCLLFYGCYWVLLRRHTFFKLNRFYLLGTLLVSLVLPKINFTETILINPAADLYGSPSAIASSLPVRETDWLEVALVVYLFGVVCLSASLLLGFFRLYRLVSQGEQVRQDGFILVILPQADASLKNMGSFSFFNLLIVSTHDYENSFDTILKHETVHIRQKHSLDILLIEILKIAFWFNPALWLYKYSLREIHEFLADQGAENREAYAYFLIGYAQDRAFGSLTNNFFNSFLLKDRVKMLYSKSTSYWSLVKYLSIIPLICFTIMKTAARNQIYIYADRRQTINATQRAEESSGSQLGDSISKINLKKGVNPNTYIKFRPVKSIGVIDTVGDRAEQSDLGYVSRVSKYQDSLWESYDPKAGQINYYNKAKIKRIKPFYPALERYGKEFGKTLDFSVKEAPTTQLQYFTLGVKSPYASYPGNIKKVIP